MLQIVRNPVYIGERTHNGETIEAIHEGLVSRELAVRAWQAIDARRTRTPRGGAFQWDRDPYMLRGVLRCTGCGRVMTTSASVAVTVDNADSVARYYRCRGDAARPACTGVQVDARRAELLMLLLLQQADPMWCRDERARALLEHLRPVWPRFSTGERNAMVRCLIWSASWHPPFGLAPIVFDEIAVDMYIDDNPETFAHLPPRVSASPE